MQERLADILKNELRVKKSDRLLIAVSGGADSVTLLRLLNQLNMNLAVAHCNFKLRGDESDAEEVFVRSLCQQLNIELSVKHFDVKAYKEQHKVSTQEAARTLRYDWFFELMKEKRCDFLATAHNRTDNLETILINMIRGTGPKGLSGIAPSTPKHIIRPLLQFSADEIRSFASEQHWEYRVDSSNLDDHYLRNKLRHHLLPTLFEIEPSIDQIALRNAQAVREQNELFDWLVSNVENSIVERDGDQIKIPISTIHSYPQPHLILYKILNGLGFSHVQCADMINHSQTGNMHFSPTHQVNIDRGYFIASPISETPNTLTISKPGSYVFGNTTIRVEECYLNDVTLKSPDNTCHILKPAGNTPIVVRSRNTGDRIQPFGMTGHKLVSDIMIDRKIPEFQKGQLPVFLINEVIFWVGGLSFSNQFAIPVSANGETLVWKLSLIS